MSDAERELFRKYVGNSKNYFEFGSGGSSVFASSVCSTVESVESDKDWVQKVKQEAPNVLFHDVDIGPVGEWGWPLDSTYDFSKYSSAWDHRMTEPDLIFIDGRFRVACGLKVIFSNAFILIHDFDRQEYQILLDYYDVIERCQTLVVLKSKIRRLYEDYKRNPK